MAASILQNNLVTCRPSTSVASRGIWLGDGPLKFFAPVFMIQVTVAAFFTGTMDYFLRRFGFSSYFSHMIAAIILRRNLFKDFIFSYESQYMFEIFRCMANIFFPFLVVLKMDYRMVFGSGRRAILIGIIVGFLPILMTYLPSYILFRQYYLPTDQKARIMLGAVAVVGSQTSFHDVACVLSDLKILNSELGRLAIASSMTSSTFSFGIMIALSALEQSRIVGSSKGKLLGLYYIGSMAGVMLFIIYASKPIMNWMMKQVPQGSHSMKEIHVVIVLLMVLICSFLGQLLGHSPGLAPLLLGLMVPPGPPLAENIEDKLEAIVSYIFLPLFYVSCSGVSVVGVSDPLRVKLVVWLLVLTFVAKMIGTILPAMYSGMLLRDSLVLGLIMASPGIMNLVVLRSTLRYKNVNEEIYNVLIYFSVVMAGLTSILVKMMYRPSMDCITYNRRTLGDSTHNTKLRILACIYRDFNVPSILHLIEASNATDDSPISIYLLHLIELQRIAPPLIVSHKNTDNSSVYYNRSKHIINAFRHFEKQYRKIISLNSFCALSPCATMHRDIFSLAVDKRVDLVILPFHKQYNLDGIMKTETTIQNVNIGVLKVAPCPVGILIDRRHVSGSSSVARSTSYFHIALIFLGGANDREVLTFGMRMVENPSITLTVIRYNILDDLHFHLEIDEKLDAALLNDFRDKYTSMEGIIYIEEEVPNCLGIVKAMRNIEDGFDLIMVGRQHPRESERFKGLSEWNEYPELGIMGDMLATSKLYEDVPILVLQQRYTVSNV
ncbi:hypothetical protein ACHQM5_018143 [Ranunculus cassubicifolius]